MSAWSFAKLAGVRSRLLPGASFAAGFLAAPAPGHAARPSAAVSETASSCRDISIPPRDRTESPPRPRLPRAANGERSLDARGVALLVLDGDRQGAAPQLPD